VLSVISACCSPREKRVRPLWVTCYLFIVSVTVAWFFWATFAQIGLFSEINCDAGCDEFSWPPTKDLVVNQGAYKPDAYMNGTAFCYPDDGRYNGTRFEKPISTGGCDPPCSAKQNDDPLVLKVTSPSVWLVIMGHETQLCLEDECFYTSLEDFNAMCNFVNPWTTALVKVD